MLRNFTRALLMLLLPVSAVAARNAGAPPLPDTAAGRHVAAYLKAFNSGDERRMRAFIEEHVAPAALARRSADERLQVYREMRGNMETIEVARVLASSPDAVSVLARTKRGEWFEIGFMFEASEQHELLGLRVEDAEAPGEAGGGGRGGQGAGAVEAGAALTEAEALAAVEKRVGELVSADEFSGTVLIAKGGKPVLQKAYGLASREYNVPNRLDTKFNLGSINKIFTQIAVGQLIEQGKLSLDDRLGKHLPDYPNRDAAGKVTIRQLLSMTSGVGDFFGPRFEEMSKHRLRGVKDFLPLFAGEPLRFEPGTRREYSNGGYIVLGAVVEKVSGRDYYEYVREHVFGPAGMRDTDWYEADLPVPNLASGYTRRGAGAQKPRRNNIYTRPAKGSPAGGGYSTAEDLLKFALALQSGKLRQPDFREPQAGATRNASASKPAGFGGVGIAGGAEGINALLEVGADEGEYTVVVMSNYDPPSAEKLGKQIRGWLARVKN